MENEVVRKAFTAQITPLGKRSIRAVCSTGDVDRMGEVVVQSGGDLKSYRQNPIVLFDHQSAYPVGTATKVAIVDGKLVADITFADEGVSPKADEVYRLVKAGILKAVSIGFEPSKVEPMDPAKPRGPVRYLKWSLAEISIVSIPANTNAVITDKARRSGADRNSPSAKAERIAKAAAIRRRVATEDARLPINPAKASRMERARRLAAGERLADIDAPAPVPQVKQHDPDAARRAACNAAFLKVDSNSPEARQRRAAELATPPTEKARQIQDAKLAKAQREDFQRRYGRDAS